MTSYGQATGLAEKPLEEQRRQFADYVAQRLKPAPGSIPRMAGIDIHGTTIALNGDIGGDMITYMNFGDRYDLDARIEKARSLGQKTVAENLERLKSRAGVLLADVAGHEFEDAAIALMLHQAFQTGALYELDQYGEITTRLFEQVNTRFCKSETTRNLAKERDDRRYISMIYGEIEQTGRFRFVSAGHPAPLIYSAQYDRLVDLSPDRLTSFFPLGMFPTWDAPDARKYHRPPTNSKLPAYKEKYTVNELNLMGAGDILLLYTDGLTEANTEHDLDRYTESYFKEAVRETISRNRHAPAHDICERIVADRRHVAPVTDDLSVVVIKKQ